ncbi:MAG: hypothetical protein A2X23_10895 [Chloroflexi bacterium GWC2_73_18]|nr:MAG: hypothetical protein A2X23_10895 [Chloroflexi bacterium GWC2_73_18]
MTISCPRCGRPVTAEDEVCPGCGARLAPGEAGRSASFSERYRGTAWETDLAGVPEAAPLAQGSTVGAGPLRLLAAGSWLAFAALTGIPAAQALWAAPPAGEAVASPLALVNGLAALVALLLAGLLLAAPFLRRGERRLLEASVAWGLGSAAGGLLQVWQGRAAEDFTLSILLALAAGGLSLAARGALPDAGE